MVLAVPVIVGIVIAIAVFFVIVSLIAWFVKNRQKNQETYYSAVDDHTYSKDQKRDPSLQQSQKFVFKSAKWLENGQSFDGKKREGNLKIMLSGPAQAGKTALFGNLESDEFSGEYKPTIGAEFSPINIGFEDSSGSKIVITSQIWVTSGDEKSESLNSQFYRGASALIFVVDPTQSFEENDAALQRLKVNWDFLLSELDPPPMVHIIVTKSDLNQTGSQGIKIQDDSLGQLIQKAKERFGSENVDATIRYTSAKDSEGVRRNYEHIVWNTYQRVVLKQPPQIDDPEVGSDGHQMPHSGPFQSGNTPYDDWKRLPILKTMLVGVTGAGKTALNNRFAGNSFSEAYNASFGVDFFTKDFSLNDRNGSVVDGSLQSWDTAGDERYQSNNSSFYKGTQAFIFAIDPNKPFKDNKECLEKFIKIYQENAAKQPKPMVHIVVTKSDQFGTIPEERRDRSSLERLHQIAQSGLGKENVDERLRWVSAKTGEGVKELFDHVALTTYERMVLKQPPQAGSGTYVGGSYPGGDEHDASTLDGQASQPSPHSPSNSKH